MKRQRAPKGKTAWAKGFWWVAFAAVFPCVFASGAQAQHLRIVNYNIEADVNGVTAPRNGLPLVLEGIGEQNLNGVLQPIDVLALEETTSNAATVAPIAAALNSYYGGTPYAVSGYQGTQSGGATTGNGPNSLVYNTNTVQLVASVGVTGTPDGSSAFTGRWSAISSTRSGPRR